MVKAIATVGGFVALLGTFVATQIYIQSQINQRDRAQRHHEKLLAWVGEFAPDERQGAILALGSLDNPEAQIQLLADMLGLETDADRLNTLQQALVSSGKRALPYLQKINQSTRTDLDALRYSTNEVERQGVAQRLRATQRAIAKLLALHSGSLAGVNLNRTHLGPTPSESFTLVLEKTDLSGIQWRGALLEKASFKGSQFSSAGGDNRFGTPDDIHADFTASQLTEVDFTGAFLSHVFFDYSDLSGAILNYANLSEAQAIAANFSNTELVGADLRQADLSDAIFTGANLGEANLTGSLAIATRFTEVSARGANFRVANLTRSDWQGADLTGANFSQSNLEAANLSATKLTGADLRSAQLQNANFQQADLTSANFQGANVAGADFQKAQFFKLQSQQGDRLVQHSDTAIVGLLQGVDFTQAKNLDDKQIVYICAQGGIYPECPETTQLSSPRE